MVLGENKQRKHVLFPCESILFSTKQVFTYLETRKKTFVEGKAKNGLNQKFMVLFQTLPRFKSFKTVDLNQVI